MSKIKKQQCPSCGGNLIDDSEKQLYRCTSCGSSYDYDYFRDEQLHEMGETYLSRGEVKAAIDAYRLILKQAPHDFYALRGLMLAAAFLKDMDGFAHIGEAKHFSYDPKLVNEVIESASEEDKEYFTEFGKVYADKKQLVDRYREIKSLRREREGKEAFIRLTDNTRYEYYFDTKYGKQHPRSVFIAVSFLTALYSVPSFVGAFTHSDDGDMGTVVFFAVICGLSLLIGGGINIFVAYPKMKMIKKIDADVRDLKIESEATARKIRDLEAEAEELSDDIRKAISELRRKDRRIAADSAKEQVPVFGKIKQHQCPTCGGSLRIDSDKQVYHCAFCGATYDYEYFREDLIHEAGETYLSRGEFMATTEAYEFMLKKDPHDFLALRGLMLAAARLSDMSELDKVSEDFSYDSRVVSRVLESAAEEDKEYFTEFAKVYTEKKRLLEYAEEIEALREEKGKIDAVIDQNDIWRPGNPVNDGYSSNDDLMIGFIGLCVCTAFFILMAIVVRSVSFFALISLVLVVVTLGYYFRMRKIKRLEKANAELYEEAGKMADKISDLENESSKLTRDIRLFIHDFVRKDRLIMRDRA